ncbi:hypothetical protein ACFXTI_013389 [Malus domestica]
MKRGSGTFRHVIAKSHGHFDMSLQIPWVVLASLAVDTKRRYTFVCTILDQSRNYRAPANVILSRTQKSSPPTRRPITTRHVSRLEANQSAARVNIKNQS